jgi:hypothetical protein
MLIMAKLDHLDRRVGFAREGRAVLNLVHIHRYRVAAECAPMPIE